MDSSQLTDFIKVGGAESILEWGFGTGRFFVGTCLTLNMSFGGEGEGSDEGDRSQIIAHFQVRQSTVKVWGRTLETKSMRMYQVCVIIPEASSWLAHETEKGSISGPVYPYLPLGANSSAHTDLSLHTEQSL